jgi:glutamate synthase domain-containing protein 2
VAGLVFGALTLVGLVDYLQPRQAIRRNYPVLAHFRFFFEYIRPEIRQYFIEADSEELPFSRAQRSIVYQRAKQRAGQAPLRHPVRRLSSRTVRMDATIRSHRNRPCRIEATTAAPTIGGQACTRPYSASVLNISAMSYGSLSGNAILAP